MKKLLSTLWLALFATLAWAQTPDEIISKMESVMNQHEAEGVVMTMDMKMPIVGTISSRMWTLDGLSRMETGFQDEKVVMFTDAETVWSYDAKKNEVTIEAAKHDDAKKEGDTSMFKGVTEGYDVSVKKETDTAWFLQCKKSRTNKKKDDPKNMEIVVAKGTYMPVSLSARISPVTMTMRDISFGVSKDMVTYDPAKFPGATIVDKR